MSGGEFQRLHAARVYLQAFTCSTEGHCIFLDEPTSALDLGYEIRVIDSFQKLAKEKNYIICGIFHNMGLLKNFADNIIMLKKGRLFGDGHKDEVLTRENIIKLYDINEEHKTMFNF